MHLIVGDVTSPPERARDQFPAVSHIPEMVRPPEVLSALTSPFYDVITATGSLLFPLPFFHPPVLSLSDLASYRDHRTLPEIARPWNGGVDCASGSGSGNDIASCDGDSESAVCGVSSASPLDLSPPRTERPDNIRHHGNRPQSHYLQIVYVTVNIPLREFLSYFLMW